ALIFLCVFLIVSILLKNIFYYFSMMMREILKVQVIGNAREKLYEKVTRLHLGYFSEQRKGDLISRVTADVQEIEHTVVFSLDLILRDPITIIMYFALLFSLSLEMTLFTFILVPLAGGMVALISRRLRKTAKKAQASIGTLVSILEESLGALRIIKAYRAEIYIRDKFNQENKRFINHVFSIARTRELASPFSEFAGVLIVVCILLYGGSLIFADNPSLNTSEFILYVLILTQLLTPIKAISTAISYIQRGLEAGRRVFEIMDTPVEIKNAPNAQVLPGFSEKIEFSNVSFRYGERWVIKDLSFEILKGQKVALVGETGSGKTTIAELLSRFYEVGKGQILVDGLDLREIQLSSLMAQMGIVTQEAILFNDSIYNNIAFAHADVSPEEVERAAKVANAHDFIMKTEQGYDTLVGDRGTKLSGGQRQ
ncbi:MAG: ABC transporter ATP-binding protein, partial [Bacteroidota bacterium]